MAKFRAVCLAVFGLTISGAVCAQTPHTDESSNYAADILGVTEAHLSADYWVANTPDADVPFVEPRDIAALNAETFALDENLALLSELPDAVDGETLEAYILDISSPASADRFTKDGDKLTERDYRRYQKSLNLRAVADETPVKFGLVLRRTSMRTFPTDDQVYNSPSGGDIDRFQETALFPGQAVAVLHESRDGKWVFAQSYNYRAWMKAADVAVGDRRTVLDYAASDDVLVVTGPKVFTVFNPEEPAVSEVQLDMGVRLPLGSVKEYGHDIYGQNPYAAYIVILPTADENGALVLKPALIARSQDVKTGYLPFSPETVIRQSFKFLGERYGWGHDYNGRDCTGFVSEVYKSVGILMPRNSGQQGSGEYGVNIRFDEDTPYEEKLAAIKTLEPGDLLYIPGHVMMYLGLENGVPYIIHDVHGYSHKTPEGDYYEGVLNGVSVTPLTTLHLSEEMRYIDRIYNLKKIRPGGRR